MQINSIELFRVALPLREPQETPAGRLKSLETVLVRMQSGEVAGWGEASPGNAPTAGTEWAAGVFACLRDWLAPKVVGSVVESGDKLAEMLEPFRGNRFAKAALDMAWWDLKARQEGRPLYQVLGGQRETIEVGPTFDQMESVEDFLGAIGRAFEDGFARVKLKMRPGWDVHMVEAVRRELAVETMHVDLEGALNLGYMDMLCRLDDFALEMIEQPLPADDLVGAAMVQETVRTPVCLDEGVTTVGQAEMALDLKSCGYVNLKPGRVGGLTPAVAIHDACRYGEVACYVGANRQSAVATRHGYALASMANCTYPADYFAAGELFEHDLAEPLLPERDPADGKRQIKLWPEPGIGIEPDPELLQRHCLAREKLEGS